MAPKSIGWWQAFASVAGALPEGLDRYRYLRQLDDNTKWQNEQHQMVRSKFDQDNAEHDLQMQNLQTALLGKQRDEFTNTYGVGDRLTPDAAQQGTKLGYGGLISSKPTFDFTPGKPMDLGSATDLQGNDLGPQQGGGPSYTGTGGNADYFSGTRSQRTAQDVMDRQNALIRSQLEAAILDKQVKQHQIGQFGVADAEQTRKLKAEELYRSLIKQNPKMSPQDRVKTAASLDLDPNEADKTLLSYQTDMTRANNAGGGGSGPIDPAQVQRAAAVVLAGKMAPSQAVAFYGGMGTNAAQFKRAMTDAIVLGNKDFDFQKAEAGYQFGKSAGTQGTVRFIDNAQKTIPILERTLDKLDLSDAQPINWLELGAKNKLGDSDVAAFNFLQTTMADEFGKIITGGGTGSVVSDTKIKMAAEALNHDMSRAQWREVLSVAKEVFQARRDSLTKDTFMEKKDNSDANTPPAGTWQMVNGIMTFVPTVKK